MRERRRYIAALLLIIDIVMSVIIVIPHHHHPGGSICLRQELTAPHVCTQPAHACTSQAHTCAEHRHSHTPIEEHGCCSIECLTRFHSLAPAPTAGSNPEYALVAILFTEDIIEHLLRARENRKKKYRTLRDALYQTELPRTTLLRAPPTPVFA